MDVLVIYLSFFAAMVLPPFCIFMAVRLTVPWLVGVLGERYFGEIPKNFGCTSSCLTTVLGVFATLGFSEHYGFAALLALPICGNLCIFVWLLWLGWSGLGDMKKQFFWQDNESLIVSELRRAPDGALLRPTCVEQSSVTSPYDAFTFYRPAFYYVTLYNGEEVLARNRYNQEKLKDAALARIYRTCEEVPCRGLDLIFVWRREPLLWHRVRLGYQWTTLLCGPLTELSVESRAWWQQHLQPSFREDGWSEITASELQVLVEELEERYKTFIEADKRRQFDIVDLKLLCRTASSPIQVMTSKRHDLELKALAPHGAKLHRAADNVQVRVQPTRSSMIIAWPDDM